MLDSMLGFSKRAARITWTILLIFALLYFIYAIRETVLVFMAALFFAYMLWPAVNLIERWAPRWLGRTVALTIVYLLFLGALATVIATFGSYLVDEITSVSRTIQDLVHDPHWIERLVPSWLGSARQTVMTWVQGQFSTGTNVLLPYLMNAATALKGTLTGAFYVVLVPILAFFFIKDGHQMREYLIGIFDDVQRRDLVEDILDDIHVMLGHYIRVLVTLSLISLTVYSAFLSILHFPYAVLLAFIAALLEFIPVIGPLTSGVIMAIVAGFMGVSYLVWLVVFWVLYRGLQDYVISPHLMGRGVEIHPLVILFGVLAGEQIGGIAGMFFSVPVIAMVRVIVTRARRSAQKRKTSPVEIKRA